MKPTTDLPGFQKKKKKNSPAHSSPEQGSHLHKAHARAVWIQECAPCSKFFSPLLPVCAWNPCKKCPGGNWAGLGKGQSPSSQSRDGNGLRGGSKRWGKGLRAMGRGMGASRGGEKQQSNILHRTWLGCTWHRHLQPSPCSLPCQQLTQVKFSEEQQCQAPGVRLCPTPAQSCPKILLGSPSPQGCWSLLR